jgi:hypothetical protein
MAKGASEPFRRALSRCVRCSVKVPSLHAPLSAAAPDCQLVLELLPLPCRLFSLPMNHMQVNLPGRPYRPMPQPCGHRP